MLEGMLWSNFPLNAIQLEQAAWGRVHSAWTNCLSLLFVLWTPRPQLSCWPLTGLGPVCQYCSFTGESKTERYSTYSQRGVSVRNNHVLWLAGYNFNQHNSVCSWASSLQDHGADKCSTYCLPEPLGYIFQSYFLDCQPSVQIHGVVLSQVQDFAVFFTELCEISFSPFL